MFEPARPTDTDIRAALTQYHTANRSPVERQKVLTFDLEQRADKPREGVCAQEIERLIGGLGRNPGTQGIAGDFIGLNGIFAGRTIDHLGQPKKNGADLATFEEAIDSHYAKQGIDFVLIDVKHFGQADRLQIVKHLQKQHKANASRTLFWDGVNFYKQKIPDEKNFSP